MRIENWCPEKITAEIEKRAMDRLAKAGEIIAAHARGLVRIGKNVPQGKGKWSKREAGALKRSIRMTRLAGDPKMNIRVYAGSKDVYYARFVEYGTAKMSAKPFLRPALTASKGSIKQTVENG